MIDLTPLDVRNKRGDFKKLMRGYDPQEVDVFLELAAERLEGLVRENIQLRERTQTLQDQVTTQTDREQAVQDALVTAQELRADIRAQSQREADHILKEAEAESRRLIAEAEAEVRRMIAGAEEEVRGRVRGIERQLDHAGDTIQEMERRRVRFLSEFRGLLERELDVVEVEEDKAPFEERTIDLELGSARGAGKRSTRPTRTEADAEEPPLLRRTETETYAPERERSAPEGRAPEGEREAPGGEQEAPKREGETAEREHGTENDGGAGRVPEPRAESAARKAPSPSSGPSEVASARESSRPLAPPPAVDDEPSSLELELMAGAEGGGGTEGSPDQFPGVPDLETVLAEAGIEEVSPPPPEEISPPAPRRPEDSLVFFDPDDDDAKR